MTDIRDPNEAERLRTVAPDAYYGRREFLARTAALAGLGGMGLLLHPDTLLAQAADSGVAGLPAPQNIPIDTFVVLMMENRSFDHYLGWLPGADGRQAGLTYTDPSGKSYETHRLATNFQGCGYLDPDHSWEGGRTEYDGGRMDGFLKAESDIFAIGYYEAEDLPFIPHVAQAFTTFDRFFCSLLASTYPNREYMHAAQSYGMTNNDLPQEKGEPTGFPDTTIFKALTEAGVSNKYFYSDIPVSALWGAPGLARASQVQEYYELAAAGQLPSVSFVDPAFVGEEEGTSGDEHPFGDVRTGQAFMADVVHAFLESPQWQKGALFVVYDEWGGFFDHVRPPRVPDIRASAELGNDFGQMGMRIPAVAVSPYVRRSYVDHGIFGFESILKMIRYRFGLAPLTTRDKYARNIALAFDFDSEPRLDIPSLPHPPDVMSASCEAPQASTPNPGLDGGKLVAEDASVADAAEIKYARTRVLRPKPHDLATLATSGYLERLGFDYRPATPARIFRHPSSLGMRA